MKVESAEYQEHPVFSKIDDYIKFYEMFSDSVSNFVTMGTRALLNIDTYVYTSMSGTLESLNLILKSGHINDAFSLLRKFHDSIVMNIYTNLYIEDNITIDTFLVEKIQNWLSGTTRDQLPDYRGMYNYIKDSKRAKPIYELLNVDDKYKKIRNRCTDNMHYNFYWNVMLNDNKIYLKERGKYLDIFLHDLEALILMHLSYIFYINNHYLASSDHVDYLDAGMTPPEDSQYWVAPYIQEIFTNLIAKNRPNIGTLIKDNTAMHLE